MDKREIEELVKTSIQTKIIQAFKETPEAIDMLVKSALNKEVDENGCSPNALYSRKKMPYLEFLVGQMIRDIARVEVEKIINDRRSEIADIITKKLLNDDCINSMTDNINITFKGN